jgi:predicted DNA-binding protein with PD1-like motif
MVPNMTTRSKTIIAASLVALSIVAAAVRTDLSAAAADNNSAAVSSSGSRLWVVRLHPGDDLVDSIMEFARQHSINAGGILTCVGSLDRVRLRYANQSRYEDLDAKGQHFEIVSLVGTFSTADRHLHFAVANEQGAVFGGHADTGNRVYTTAEIILIEGVDWTFSREKDPITTYRELAPVQRNKSAPSNTR